MEIDGYGAQPHGRVFVADRGEYGNNALTYGRDVSEASTRTLRGDSPVDVAMSDAGTLPAHSSDDEKRFVVSIDFGTTFSSVSFIALPKHQRDPPIDRKKIRSIVNYPGEPNWGQMRAKSREVPTESWYPQEALFNDSTEEVMMSGGNFNDDVHEDENALPDEILPQEDDGAADNEPDDSSSGFLWGFGIQELLQDTDHKWNRNRLITRSKLLLDASEHTDEVRRQLRPILDRLRRKNLIKKDEDVIAHYLMHLFRHVKEQLTRFHGFTMTCQVEFVLCVPAMWTPQASRTMQTVMETAISRSGFGSVDKGSVDNLFIVSEPEAASVQVLADNEVAKAGESFVLIDAGGGTVDAITYTVDKTLPLRLKNEAVESAGELCGSSYLNEALQKLLVTRLRDETYLEVHGQTIQSIVDAHIVKFENKSKRDFDVTKRPNPNQLVFSILGLRPNLRLNFKENRLRLSHADAEGIFMPRLKGVARLMKGQLDLAKQRNLEVHKVILIGGFASSPSLRQYLREELGNYSKLEKRVIRLIAPPTPETVVASGAVLRALDKEGGPSRIIHSSYGFLRTEDYEPDKHEAHRVVKRASIDPHDGRKYVKKTIDWFVKKGQTLPPRKEYRFEVVHTFAAKLGFPFICEELLYVSDTSTESHYRAKDPRNEGAQIAGSINVDMTFLKTEGYISPVDPEPGMKGQRHYKVQYELVMIVDGRNMTYEARYPSGANGTIQQKSQISIAAAFVPGTARDELAGTVLVMAACAGQVDWIILRVGAMFLSTP